MKYEDKCNLSKEQWPNVTFCIRYFDNECEKGCRYALEMETKKLERSKLEKKVIEKLKC